MRRAYTIDFGERIDQPGGSFSRIETPQGSESRRLESIYRLDKSSIMLNLGARLPLQVADLLDIGVAVALADRISPRSRDGRELSIDESGVRLLHIRIPVRSPEHWSQPRIHQALSNALLESSGDEWTFEFVPRNDQTETFSEQLPLEIPSALRAIECILIFSGGLDSLLGLLHRVEATGHRSVALACVSTHDRISDAQTATAAEVRRYHRVDLPLWRMRFGLTRDFPRNERESSQRARGFLYLVNGIACAMLAGLTTITVFENGIGAINLPYSLGQLGHRSNRAMHPRTLMAVTSFVREAFGQPIQVINPALWQTKQQIVRAFGASPAFRSAAPKTVSCDRFPYKPQDRPCGVCTSCILRRLSLSGADLDFIDSDMYYESDILDASFHHNSPSPCSLVPLIAMNGQVDRLRRHLPDSGELNQVLQHFPDFADLFDARAMQAKGEVIEIVQQLSDLLKAHVNEWTTFIAKTELSTNNSAYISHVFNPDERRVIAS